MQVELCSLSICELAPLIQTKELSPVDLTKAYLERIKDVDRFLHSFITVFYQDSLQTALLAEKEIANGKYRGPLHGIPIAVKDLFASSGTRTTAGSRILRDNFTDYDASVVARLKSAGAVLLGKLAMSEFAAGDDINPLTGLGPVRNPWSSAHSAGGSSSGSAASVAAFLCAGALGTDTGGSIRNPSAFNGIVGMKPSFGLVSRFGTVPLSWSLDHVGPMTKRVEDNALMLEAIAGPDTKDPWCSPRPASSYRQRIDAGVRGLRIGIPKQYFFEYATREVGDAVHDALHVLQSLGASLSEVELPHLKYTVGVEFAILLTEALAYHSRYLRQGDERQYTRTFVSTVLDPARFISAVDYIQAQRLRKFFISDFEQAFTNVDVILAPGSESVATPLDDDDLVSYETPKGIMDYLDMWPQIYCPANIAGVPSLAIPCGFSKSDLPLSLAIIGKHFDEARVYQVGYAYERETQWYKRRPVFVQ